MIQPHAPVLRKSAGAFDLSSIVAGAVIVGILTAGILAAVFGVVPFSQDRGAKQDLASIRTAEGAARTKDNRFMSRTGLLDTGYLAKSSTASTSVASDAKGTCYVALAKSGTGKVFYLTDQDTEPRELTAGTTPGCLPGNDLEDLIEEVGGVEQPAAPAPQPGNTPEATAPAAPDEPATAPETATPLDPGTSPEATNPATPGTGPTNTPTDPTPGTPGTDSPGTPAPVPGSTTPAAPGDEPTANPGSPDPDETDVPSPSATPTAPGTAPTTPAVPGESDPAPTTPEDLKLTALSPLKAQAIWSPVPKAYGYKVEHRVAENPWVIVSKSTGYTSAIISALPEQTVSVRVTALFSSGPTAPVTVSTTLPDSALKNPSFEQGLEGWTAGAGAPAVAGEGYGGNQSAEFSYSGSTALSQVVMIPEGRTKLTFWSRQSQNTYPVYVYVDRDRIDPVTAMELNVWGQQTVDLSAYEGRNVTLGFGGGANGNKVYLDDIALEAITVPDAPFGAAAASREGTATVTWVNSYSGGIPTTSYTATAWLNGKAVDSVNVDGSQRTATLTGLKTGTSYTFTVTATNTVGTSELSAATKPVPVHEGAIANPGFEQGFQAWTKTSNGNLATFGHTGDASVALTSFSSSQGVWQPVTVPAGKTKLNFWYRTSTSGASYSVGIFVNGIQVDTAPGTALNTWALHRVDLSAYAGKSVRLGFGGGGGIYPAYVDDVALEPVVVADAPATVVASSREGTATVTWTSAFSGGTPVTSYTATAWLNGKAVDSVNVDGSQRTATLTGLKTGTSYTFTVTATNTVGASELSAATAPVPVHDGAVANPGFEQGLEAWTKTSNGNLATFGHTGDASVALTSFSSSQGVWQTVTVPAGKTKLTFWYRTSTSGASYSAGIFVNGIQVDTAPGTALNTWALHRVDLSAYAGKSIKLGFGGGSGTYPTQVDDVALEPVVVPDAPGTVAASSREGTATVTWTSAFSGGTPVTSYTATAWLNDKAVDSVNVAADQRTATLTGVKTGTSYTFTVTANNTVGTSEPSTATGPVPVHDGAVANPGFEQGLEAWTKTSNGNLATFGHTGDASVALTSFSSQGVWQPVTVPAGKTKLTFWYRTSTSGASYSAGIFVNGIQVDTAPGTALNTWALHRVDLSAYAGKSIKLGFGGGGGTYPAYVDDVALEPVVAPDTPGTVAASSREGTATVTWTSAFSGGTPVTSYTATAWLNDKAVDSVSVAADQRTATLTGLTTGTSYTFTVAANNTVGTSEPSAATVPVPVHDGAVANPGFEQGLEAWTKTSTYGSLAAFGYSGDNSVALNSSIQGVSQSVTVPAGKTKLSFRYHSTLSGYPATTFVNGIKIDTAPAPALNTWTLHRVDLSAYAGKSIKLGFGGGSGTYPTQVDDVALEPVVVPDAPGAVAASSREGTATVTWTSAFSGGTPVTSYTATAWLNGEAVDSFNVAADQRTATLTGVKTGTSYTFTVTANNTVGTSEPSTATGPVPVHDGAFANPGFEQGFEAWTKTSTVTLAAFGHTGDQSGELTSINSQGVSQSVTVPAGKTKLTFRYRKASTAGTPVSVFVNGAKADTAPAPALNTWTLHTVDLSAYAGKSITLGFGGGTEKNLAHVDDVALESAG